MTGGIELVFRNLASSLSSWSSAAGDGGDSFSLFLMALTGVLIVAVLVSILFSSVHALSWLHESIAVMLLGTMLGLATHFLLRNSASFLALPVDSFSQAFYTALFPPIVFNAGFTMKKRMFMHNLGSILTYAVAGTVISTLVIGLLLWVLFAYSPASVTFGVQLSLVECLLFGTLLSATDTVSTIAHLLELNVDPLLYSIVFGESVLNDAVAITLCHALQRYYGHELSPVYLWYIVRDFFVILLGSCGIGLATGFACAFLKARMKRLNLSPAYDMTLLLLVAYFSYVSADAAGMSGVISIFVCAIVTSHYTWYTISTRARVSLFTAAGTLDYAAQTVVFFCIGLFLFGRPDPWVRAQWNPLLILGTVGLLFVSRALNVFPLSLLLNLGRCKNKISPRLQVVVWWCGMRGVVTLLLAFGLAVANRQLLINTTFVVVFFTNIFIGITTKPLVKRLRVGSVEASANVLDPESDQSTPRAAPGPHAHTAHKQPAIARLWARLDNGVLRPLLGGLPDGAEKRRAQADMFIGDQHGAEQRPTETPAELVNYVQLTSRSPARPIGSSADGVDVAMSLDTPLVAALNARHDDYYAAAPADDDDSAPGSAPAPATPAAAVL